MPKCSLPHENSLDIFLTSSDININYLISREENLECHLPDSYISLQYPMVDKCELNIILAENTLAIDICSELLKAYKYISSSGNIPVRVTSFAEVKKKEQFKEVKAEIAIEPAICCSASIYIEPRLQAGINLGNEVKINKTKYMTLQAGISAHTITELSKGIIPGVLATGVPVYATSDVEVCEWRYVQDLYANSLSDIEDQDLQDLYYKKK